MAEWSKDHMAAIGPVKLQHSNLWKNLDNLNPGGALRWKVETTG
jgi:hypothetical protein